MTHDEAKEASVEPDARFTLANERTFLAWNRTALALLGGGLAAGQLIDFSSTATRLVVSLAPVVLGLVLGVASHRRWRAVEHALRHGRPLPPSQAITLLTGGLVFLAVAFAAVAVVDALDG